MSIHIFRLVELMMRPACCQTIRSRLCLHKAVFPPVGHSGRCISGVPVLHRRAFSLDSLSSGPGRHTLGQSSQQPLAERTSSSALAQRNLSAVALQVGTFLWLCLICPLIVLLLSCCNKYISHMGDQHSSYATQ